MLFLIKIILITDIRLNTTTSKAITRTTSKILQFQNNKPNIGIMLFKIKNHRGILKVGFTSKASVFIK
jgi:hypothetical protein